MSIFHTLYSLKAKIFLLDLQVMHAINHHYGETAIRGKFQEYVQRFVRLTALYEIETFGSTNIGTTPKTEKFSTLGTGLAFPDENTKQREMVANINRIEGWRQTISYKYYQQVPDGY